MSARDAEMVRLAELAVERWLDGLGAPPINGIRGVAHALSGF